MNSPQLQELIGVQRGVLDAVIAVKAQIDGFTKGIKIGDFDETVVLVQIVP